MTTTTIAITIRTQVCSKFPHSLLRSGSQKKYRQNRKYGSPGLVVMGGDSKVVGSNPGTVYCMDIFHIHLL